MCLELWQKLGEKGNGDLLMTACFFHAGCHRHEHDDSKAVLMTRRRLDTQ